MRPVTSRYETENARLRGSDSTEKGQVTKETSFLDAPVSQQEPSENKELMKCAVLATGMHLDKAQVVGVANWSVPAG